MLLAHLLKNTLSHAFIHLSFFQWIQQHRRSFSIHILPQWVVDRYIRVLHTPFQWLPINGNNNSNCRSKYRTLFYQKLSELITLPCNLFITTVPLSLSLSSMLIITYPLDTHHNTFLNTDRQLWISH